MNHAFRRSILAILIFTAGWSAALHGELLPIKYESPADKARAIYWLGIMKSESALPLLIQLCDDKDGAVRMAAVVALGEIKDPKAAPTLAKIANDPAQASVKGVISFEPGLGWKSMSDLPGSNVHPVQYAAQRAILKLPPGDKPPQFITGAMETLRNLDRKSLDRLDRTRERTRDEVVKYYASAQYKSDDAIYMGGYNAMGLLELYPGPGATKALASALGCGGENLELMASYKLPGRPREESLPLIREVLKNPSLTPLTLTACLTALNKIDPAAAHPVALRLVEKYKKADVHEWARMPNIASPQLLAALKKEDVPLLAGLLDSQSVPARRDAITALINRVGGGLPPLDELVDLENIPDEKRAEAVEIFLQQLNKQGSDWVTFKASYQLGRLKVKEAVPGLLREIEYPSWGSYVLYKGTASYYQQMAGWALTQIADPATIAPLRKIALDEEKQFVKDKRVIRTAAILAYARLAGKDAIKDLTAILNENDEYLSDALRGAPHEIILPIEEQAVFPELSRVQDAAAIGLADVGGDDARKSLVDSLKNGRPLTPRIAQSIFRLDANALDDWSTNALKSNPSRERDIAVAVRFSFFPSTVADLAHEILHSSGDSMTVDVALFLQRKSLGSAKITKDLVQALSDTNPGPDACQSRLNWIEAIGRQGGPEAEAALIAFVESGVAKSP